MMIKQKNVYMLFVAVEFRKNFAGYHEARCVVGKMVRFYPVESNSTLVYIYYIGLLWQ